MSFIFCQIEIGANILLNLREKIGNELWKLASINFGSLPYYVSVALFRNLTHC